MRWVSEAATLRPRRGAAIDAEVERFRVTQLALREEIDRVVEEAVGATRSDGGPWLTEAAVAREVS